MNKSIEQLKHVERVSRRTRHHQINLNQIYVEKLHQNVDQLLSQYQQTRRRLKANEKLEKQRKQMIDITIQHISNDRQRTASASSKRSLPKLPDIQNTKPSNNRPSSSLMKQSRNGHCCNLFSKNCQLYPCQPVYHYTSFMTKDHDQTLRKRNPSVDDSSTDNSISNVQELITELHQEKHQTEHRQLAFTIRNQSRLANRYDFITRTKLHLDEQSRLLQEQLTDKRKFFGHDKDYRDILKPAIQRHLNISAKFCA